MFENKLGCCPRSTVFVLDRSCKFLSPSKQHIDLDGSAKGRGQKSANNDKVGPAYKSAWTCSVEATIEYSRIIYDIFPHEYLVQVIASDEKVHKLNSKSHEQQCIPHLLRMFAGLGPPKADNEDECSLIPGLIMAVQCAGEVVPVQKLHYKPCAEEDNLARIICVTTLKNEAHLNTLVACVTDALQNQTGSIPIRNLDLTVLHVIHTTDGAKFSDKTPKNTPNLSVSVYSLKSSQLVSKLSLMVQKHFTLKSTTVTGIPMKEEQHSGSSANYDVEILHHAEVHHDQSIFDQLCGEETGSPPPVPVTTSSSAGTKKDVTKDTVMLKWCTPKNSTTNDLQPCMGAYRITPVEVNSRPAACLISFLLQGRQVMLEQPRKTGNKVISHILMSHGGDIFIHCVSTSRTPNEDPPSISEGVGGRVTDYRINDFGEFMKSNRLAPMPKKKGKPLPLQRSVNRLERCTRHCPMVISDTLIGNMMQHLEPLSTLIMKENLTDGEVLECKSVIYRLQSMESRNDVLPTSIMGVRGKGPKRDEQYRQMWAELDVFLEAASKTSQNHEKVYQCLHAPESPSHSSDSSPRVATPTSELERMTAQARMSSNELAWKEIDRYHGMSEREKTDFMRDGTNNEYLKRNTNSPSLDYSGKKPRLEPDASTAIKTGSGPAPSLLSLWTNKVNLMASKRHEEFAGRAESGKERAELYPHMNSDNNGSGRATPVKALM